MKVMNSPSDSVDLLEHRLESLLELAAELGAGDERAEVERHEALVLEPLGDVAVHDSLGEPLDDGSLADAGFADEHRIVLGAARQDLDDAANLFVATDDRVELALACRLGEIASVALSAWYWFSGVLVGDAVRCRGPPRAPRAAPRGSRRPR